MRFLLTLLFCSSLLLLHGQDCTTSDLSSGVYLHANNFRAFFAPDSKSFFDGNNASLIQETADGSFGTIFSQSLWLAGTDPAGNASVAVATYGSPATSESFAPGPLDENGLTSPDQCNQYDQVWQVDRGQIEAHIADFADNNQIDNPLNAILGWPAKGNPSFSAIAGFDLPDTPQGLAPFFDLNGDGLYQPLLGDYPTVPQLGGQHAEQIVWTVFNTLGSVDSPSTLKIEIQLLGWALNCEDNPLLNNTVFSSYRIINRGIEEIADFRVALWTDFDLGCYTDDYIGSAPEQNTYFSYNFDNLDGTVGSTCNQGVSTMGENPGVQSVTVLNHMLNSFSYTNNPSSGSPAEPATTDPNTVTEYYNRMNGLWNDGTPITEGGTGYNPGSDQITAFVFTGDPNDSNAWSQLAEGMPIGDRRGIGSISFPSLPPGASTEVDLAYAFHRAPNANHIENVTAMYEGVTSLQALYDDNFANGCTQAMVCTDDCIWTGDLNADGIANHEDLLTYGFTLTEGGATRSGPYNWFPHAGDSWGSTQFINESDKKHVDADGNGIIDAADFDKTIQHYDFTRPGYEPFTEVVTGDDLTLVPASSSQSLENLSPGESFFARVQLLTDIPNLRALSFIMVYDTDYISHYNPINFGTSNALSYAYEDLAAGELDYAEYNLDVEEDFSSDLILGSLKIKSDFPNPLPTDETFVCFRNIRAYLTDGTEVTLGGQKVRLQIDGITTATEEPVWGQSVRLYPNPVGDVLQLETENITIDQLMVVDSQGRLLTNLRLNNNQLDTQALPAGLYHLRLFSAGEYVVRKFVKL